MIEGGLLGALIAWLFCWLLRRSVREQHERERMWEDIQAMQYTLTEQALPAMQNQMILAAKLDMLTQMLSLHVKEDHKMPVSEAEQRHTALSARERQRQIEEALGG